MQSSKDSELVRRPSGLHSETYFVLLRDHFSITLYGAALRSKAPPIEWLTKWLGGRLVDLSILNMLSLPCRRLCCVDPGWLCFHCRASQSCFHAAFDASGVGNLIEFVRSDAVDFRRPPPEPSAFSAQADSRSSFCFGKGGCCGCVCYRRCA
jgi:hypothetical protein